VHAGGKWLKTLEHKRDILTIRKLINKIPFYTNKSTLHLPKVTSLPQETIKIIFVLPLAEKLQEQKCIEEIIPRLQEEQEQNNK
jgi:hypothetical protein